jgi:CheY-like chemotaxis protein
VASLRDVDVNTSASSPRILVVEDQDDVRRMLVTALELDGHRVTKRRTLRKA